MRYFVIVWVGVFRRLLPCLVLVMCVAAFWTEIRQSDWPAIYQALYTLPAWKWGFALCATAGSFWALSQYDVLAHRVLNTGIDDRQARIAGGCAIAISQCTGFAPIIAAAIRYRTLPDQKARDVIGLSVWVSVFFLISWACVAICVAWPLAAGRVWLVAPACVFCGLIIIAATIALPAIRVWRHTFLLPGLRISGQILALVLIDLGCAALCLWILIPDLSAGGGSGAAAPIGFATVFAAYTIALAAGLVAGTPGGAGPFEMVLLASLPMGPNEATIAAILAFRLVYFVLPAVIATGVFLIYRATPSHPPRALSRPFAQADIVHPEHAIALQSAPELLKSARSSIPVLATRNTLIAFRQTVTGHIGAILPELANRARASGKIPCLYKISARDAVALRRSHWSVSAISQEAHIDTQGFSLDGSDKRQLRRYIRKARTQGVVTGLVGADHYDELERVHTGWLMQNGREHGVSMGRFSQTYLRNKIVFAAWQNGRMIAFISCVDTQDCLSLDLVRRTRNCPAGTMHALVLEMINAAAAEQIAHVCLAAVPVGRLRILDRNSADLYRFKQAFSPRWSRLYFAAPNRWHMFWAALDLRYNILHPPPIAEPAENTAQRQGWDMPATDLAPTGAPARQSA